LFRDVFGEDLFRSAFDKGGDYCWAPAVDISERDDGLVMEFDLPGVEKKDLNVEFKDGVLTVSGERKAEKEEKVKKEQTWYARERCLGSFSRAFRIGESYDPRKVSAVFKNGVLALAVPKKEETKPLSIAIE
jgi:HSP20 family protein